MAPPPSGPYLETRRRHAVGDKEAFDRGRRDDRDQRVRRQRQSAGIARLYADMHVDRPVGAGAPVKVQHKSDELVAQLSPNGRWLVFSSKSWSYAQVFLTHIDEDGNDSPPILIENSTAANRAVNIPEFENVPLGGSGVKESVVRASPPSPNQEHGF